jgi:two-component system, NarL family, nitrate/nitrite response regulator NarL
VTTRCVSVVITARHPVVLCGLMTLLRAEDDFTVVASCRDSATCIEAIRKLSPHLALLDLSLPVESGLQVLAAIKAERLRTRVVFLSASSDASDTVERIARSAYGVIPKDVTPRLMVQFLRQAASGPQLLPTPKSRNGHDLGRRGSPDSPSTVLTDRERQIMHLICDGLSNKAVGRELRLSEGTVKVHLHHIYQKLAIQNRTALAALAARVELETGIRSRVLP